MGFGRDYFLPGDVANPCGIRGFVFVFSVLRLGCNIVLMLLGYTNASASGRKTARGKTVRPFSIDACWNSYSNPVSMMLALRCDRCFD